MSSMLSVGVDIRTLLLADEPLKALVGNNIFPLVAPESTTGDFITVRRSAYKLARNKMGVTEEIATLLIAAFSPDYDRSLEIAEAIRRVILNTRVQNRNLDIIDAPEDLVSYQDTGQTWYSQPFVITAGDLARN